jgi:hypothetical protein
MKGKGLHTGVDGRAAPDVVPKRGQCPSVMGLAFEMICIALRFGDSPKMSDKSSQSR